MATTYERERKLTQEIAPRVEHALAGVDVLAVELVSRDRFCVFIDHPEGVDHALCARVTDLLRDYLREYEVDVSSPGIERPLRRQEHFAQVVGRKVSLRTENRKRLRGTVLAADEDALALGLDGGERQDIPYESIVRGNLIDERV
jgi:ribosome maturation factor RimP